MFGLLDLDLNARVEITLHNCGGYSCGS
jgi:hypothetical protein